MGKELWSNEKAVAHLGKWGNWMCWEVPKLKVIFPELNGKKRVWCGCWEEEVWEVFGKEGKLGREKGFFWRDPKGDSVEEKQKCGEWFYRSLRVWHLERKKKTEMGREVWGVLRKIERTGKIRKEKKQRSENRGGFERRAEKARSGERESRASIWTCSCLRGEPAGIFVVFPLLVSIYCFIFHPLLWFLDIAG